MNNYYISINEILTKTISVKAKTEEEAKEIARKLYNQEKIILDYEDFYGVEINGLNEIADDFDYSIEDLEG